MAIHFHLLICNTSLCDIQPLFVDSLDELLAIRVMHLQKDSFSQNSPITRPHYSLEIDRWGISATVINKQINELYGNLLHHVMRWQRQQGRHRSGSRRSEWGRIVLLWSGTLPTTDFHPPTLPPESQRCIINNLFPDVFVLCQTKQLLEERFCSAQFAAVVRSPPPEDLLSCHAWLHSCIEHTGPPP